MSYDQSDAEWDAMWEAASEALYPEHFERAIGEFTADRLQSFFLSHRDVALVPIRMLSEARALLPDHPNAALILAAIALEIGLRRAVLQPILNGLVHHEELAAAVADLFLKSRLPLEKLEDISLRVILEHGGIDLRTYKRPGANDSLWSEITRVQKQRSWLLHRADPVNLSDAERAAVVAQHFLAVLFPQLLTRLELHLGADGVVSCDTGWRFSADGRVSGPVAGRYRLDGRSVRGPCAGGQYALDERGRLLLEGSSDTGFYVNEGRLYGPTRQAPWIAAREELVNLLQTAYDTHHPEGARVDCHRALINECLLFFAARFPPGRIVLTACP